LLDGLFFLQTGGETVNELPLRDEMSRPPRGLELPKE